MKIYLATPEDCDAFLFRSKKSPLSFDFAAHLTDTKKTILRWVAQWYEGADNGDTGLRFCSGQGRRIFLLDGDGVERPRLMFYDNDVFEYEEHDVLTEEYGNAPEEG